MANNRIYIRCNVCGEALYLGKDFLDGFYWENYKNDGEHLEDRLNRFFDEHTYCHEPVSEDAKKHYMYDPKLFPIPGDVVDWPSGDFSIAYETSCRWNEVYNNDSNRTD